MPGLAHYMARYDHEHSSAWNKLLHGLGIPMIFLGILLLILMKWILGASFFVGGWIFLFLGHKIEGNHPAFFQGPIYLLVGPVWVAKEAWEFLKGTHRTSASEGASEGTRGTSEVTAQSTTTKQS
jgi:uncharacterized membrane protein YGL010W